MGADAPIPPFMMIAATVQDFLKKIFSTALGCPRRGANKELWGVLLILMVLMNHSDPVADLELFLCYVKVICPGEALKRGGIVSFLLINKTESCGFSTFWFSSLKH